MVTVVGVDGTGRRRGWVAVTLRDARLHSVAFHVEFANVLARAREDEATTIAVDMPIGHEGVLTDPEGRRAADMAAKAVLGPRHASIFMVPPPQALEAAASHEEACAIAERAGWIKPSAQLWGIRERLLEVNRLAGADARVREAHPEVSFGALARELDRPAPQRAKRAWAGLVERLELLHAVKLRPMRSFGGVGRAAGPDDVVDATAVAWTAHRIAEGRARALPETPPRDPQTGREVAIWY